MSERERITVERKIHELRCVIDDLTSLTQTDDGLRALRENEGALKAAENRLRDLQLDIRLPVALEMAS